jgi:deoxyribodipyrimidine photo-lyase
VSVGIDIPFPLVDLGDATRLSKQRLHARRKTPEVKAAKGAVVEKHASRRKAIKAPQRGPDSGAVQQQLGFDF